ncbi:MAG: hypothetical protein CSB55_00510 [Candidatus Cloacimonadota bacterium]|nr:MAG: hypothetical protein CSB55_00510 [Candidatus Cloacimonadota bacterium]
MAIIRPFKAVRPAKDKVRAVASLPYDVLNSKEARIEVAKEPLSFLRVVKPEVDLPEEMSLYDEAVYLKGRENLDKFMADKVLIQDEKECYYLYRQIMNGHEQLGLVAGASAEDYENNVIKKHEHTRASKEADRIKHVDTVDANTGPVFLTYPARKDLNDLAKSLTDKTPEFDFVADDGIRHTGWVIDNNEDIEKITNIFADIKTLYVADGHHRSASATKVCQKRRAENKNHTGNELYNFFLSVIFPSDQMYVMDYNRIVKDLNGLTEDEFFAKIKEKFEVEEFSAEKAYKPEKLHTFGMYISGKWHKLTAKEGTYPENDPVKSLDCSILQENLLHPVLGIGDPRKDERIDFVGGIRGLDELSKRVNEGEAVAFSMFATSMDQLMNIADAGEVMPPKSTWFEPKLRSGLFTRLLR